MARRRASAAPALPSGQISIPFSGTTSLRPRANSTTYEAGAHSRRTFGWRAPTLSPNQAILYDLTTLRDRSRLAVRNNGWAKGVVEKLISNIVGTGIKPLSQAIDESFRQEAQRLWLRWTDDSDADGLLDWYGQEAQAVRCWLEAGEVFVRLRPRLATDGLAVPLQIQVLEPEMCPHNLTFVTANGNAVRCGIELDQIGRRVAYWFYRQRPTDLVDWTVGDLVRIPATSIVHLYEPLRAGQLRGIPHLAQALIKLNELDKFDDATLLRQELANLFAGFRKSGPLDAASDVNPITGLAASDVQDGRPVVTLEPGIMQELAPGEEIQWSEPPDPPLTYPSFMKQQLMTVAAATDIPYEVLTGDWSGMNDRIARVILAEFRRSVTCAQHHIVAQMLCRPVWRAWMDAVWISQALPIPPSYATDPERWTAVRWMPQGWSYIHPVQDVQAQEAAIKAGFTSRAAVVSEQGEDSEVVDAQQAHDNARAAQLGLFYESRTDTPAVVPPARVVPSTSQGI